MARKAKRQQRLTPQSMSGISLDDALRGALSVPPPDKDKAKKKPKIKRKKGKKRKV